MRSYDGGGAQTGTGSNTVHDVGGRTVERDGIRDGVPVPYAAIYSPHVGFEHVGEAFPALAERVRLVSAGPPFDAAAAEHEGAQHYLVAADLDFEAVAALQLGQLDRARQKGFHAGDARGSAMFRHTITASQSRQSCAR